MQEIMARITSAGFLNTPGLSCWRIYSALSVCGPGSNQICFAVDVAFLGKVIDLDGLGQMKQGSNRKYLFEIHGHSVALDISEADAINFPVEEKLPQVDTNPSARELW